jgi:hypothetical protein
MTTKRVGRLSGIAVMTAAGFVSWLASTGTLQPNDVGVSATTETLEGLVATDSGGGTDRATCQNIDKGCVVGVIACQWITMADGSQLCGSQPIISPFQARRLECTCSATTRR